MRLPLTANVASLYAEIYKVSGIPAAAHCLHLKTSGRRMGGPKELLRDCGVHAESTLQAMPRPRCGVGEGRSLRSRPLPAPALVLLPQAQDVTAGTPLTAAGVVGTIFCSTLAHSMNGLRVTKDFGATHGVHSGNVESFYYCEAFSNCILHRVRFDDGDCEDYKDYSYDQVMGMHTMAQATGDHAPVPTFAPPQAPVEVARPAADRRRPASWAVTSALPAARTCRSGHLALPIFRRPQRFFHGTSYGQVA